MKLTRNFNRFERQKLVIAVLAGCFLASMTFIVLPKPRVVPSPTSDLLVSLPPSLHAASTSLVAKVTLYSQQSEEDGRHQTNATLENKPMCDMEDQRSDLCQQDEVVRMNGNSSTNSFDTFGREDANSTLQFGSKYEKQERNKMCDDAKSDKCGKGGDGDIRLPNNSSTTIIDSTPKENVDKLGASGGNMNPERKRLCDVSDPRADLCEIAGDIRIHGNSSSVTFVPSSQSGSSEGNNSWRIRPYARKGDDNALSHVRQVFVRWSKEARSCTHNHSVPAIVFSVSGYAGNIFHDFTDVLIPLFLTARQFDGEVQFLVSDMNIWWVRKYQLVLQQLSRYPVIDLSKDQGVRCFTHTIVGLRCHKELSIDPSRAPNGYSMVDFTRFMRSSLSLERDSPTRAGEQPGKKPRLLIIPRKRTRVLLNVEEIVHMAEELGYEVVVAEPFISSDVAQFARVVNSCDVMMGVHGAGLTNLVYLPTNATLIQIVPWGGLEWIAKLDFGNPAKDMKLNYLQYSISAEESSLVETYPRDHSVFKDPLSFHNRGWVLLRNTFMDKQNVTLDARRFRAVLLKALELLH